MQYVLTKGVTRSRKNCSAFALSASRSPASKPQGEAKNRISQRPCDTGMFEIRRAAVAAGMSQGILRGSLSRPVLRSRLSRQSQQRRRYVRVHLAFTQV